ncbi:YheT family hydrolase [Tautonia sociabilis]|uniref:Alpha/beta fold hydrolase n=1 Tax=Tautonia sociabilis TaxID=2080755 RepID=A0A432MKP1_9BACT|nr:alpha/beta fold hydrolase [Tautonia sociabilis]RUL87648.1 alpha/beta fold hydrolase [Tautonia sociabilis]
MIEPDAPGSLAADFPAFEPHPMLRGGHAQTLAGALIRGKPVLLPVDRVELELDDGDRLVVLESSPADCPADRPIVVLVHGLASHAESGYQARLTDRLLRLGLRVIRVNLRSAGAGLGKSRGIYHGGRSDDIRAVAEWLARRFPEAPIGLVGLSLGGNIVLKLAGEASDQPVPNLDCVLAGNPPIDLALCCSNLQRFPLNLYDRYFVRKLVSDIRRLHELVPELGPIDLARVRSMVQFDEWYTAPRNGFSGALDYYRRASAGPLIPAIRVPGLVVHALDDPFIPASPFISVEFPSQIRLELAPRGGHLGFVSRRRWGPDRRWLDARFAHWLARHWGRSPSATAPAVPGDSELQAMTSLSEVERQAVPCLDQSNPPICSRPPSPS